MHWQLGAFIIPSLFLLLGIFVFLSVRLARRRLKKSKYGHSFDFSRMPKQKINPSRQKDAD